MFDNAFAKASQAPRRNVPLRQVLSEVRQGKFANAIAHVRRILAEKGEDAYSKEKRKLPAFTPAGQFAGRANAKLVQHAQIAGMDYDHVRNLADLRAKLVADPHVVYAFTSPSDGGLKVGIRVCTCKDQVEYRQAWRAAAEYARKNWGESAQEDGQCSEIGRLCFVSHDPELFINEDAKELPVEFTVAKAGQSQRHGNRAQNTIDAAVAAYNADHARDWGVGGTQRCPICGCERCFGNAGGNLANSKRWACFNSEHGPFGVALDALHHGDALDVDAFVAGRSRLEHLRAEGYLNSPTAPAPGKSQPGDMRLQRSSSNGVENDPRPVITCMADVQPEDVHWLWPFRIALGKLTMIAGDPGLGKSMLSIDIAARVSRGGIWPDASGSAPQGDVLIMSAEDGAADTIRPRLDAAEAQVSRVFDFRSKSQPRPDGTASELPITLADIALIEQALKTKPKCKLVIIDPIGAYMGSIDSHKDAEVRSLLAPLATLAEKYGVAVLLVAHLNKSNVQKALHRVGGSVGLTGAPRAAWLVAADPSDKDKRIMTALKNNLAADPGGLAFRVRTREAGTAIEWIQGPVELDADQLLAAPKLDRTAPAAAEAKQFLLDELAEGSLQSATVYSSAKKAGIGKRTLDSAKAELRIRSEKRSGPDGAAWWWVLPAQPCSPSEPSNSLQPCNLDATSSPNTSSDADSNNIATMQEGSNVPPQKLARSVPPEEFNMKKWGRL